MNESMMSYNEEGMPVSKDPSSIVNKKNTDLSFWNNKDWS